jgi:diacylglycerol kinase (ATP)
MGDSRKPHEAAQDSAGAEPSIAASARHNGTGLARMAKALACSMRGLRAAFAGEAAFRQEIALAAVLIPVALWAPFSPIERVLLIGSMLLVLIIELLNSAIEKTLDRVSREDHRLTGMAKDMGSAAVLMALLVLALTWLAIAGPVLAGMFLTGASAAAN